jgi:Ser/Thr protein kinase RdoA (MazF antagonist)
MLHSVQRLFDRVQTPRDAAAHWPHDPRTLTPVEESQNFVYRFHEPDGGPLRYLRLTHETHRTRELIEAELDFVNHLAAAGADVAAPVRSREGNLVEVIESPMGQFYAAVFVAVHGQPVRWDTDAENRAILHERGKTLGKIHRLSQTFRAHPERRRFHWYEDSLFANPDQQIPPSELHARREHEAVFGWLRRREMNTDNYGLIHGDFGSHNTLRANGTAVAFDFDDCCYHWFLFDLAVAILPAAKLPDKYRKPYMRVLLEGYAGEKSLNGEGPAEVGMFCRLSALYRYVTLLRQLDLENLSGAERAQLESRRAALMSPISWT